jgi:hypothetical protein
VVATDCRICADRLNPQKPLVHGPVRSDVGRRMPHSGILGQEGSWLPGCPRRGLLGFTYFLERPSDVGRSGAQSWESSSPWPGSSCRSEPGPGSWRKAPVASSPWWRSFATGTGLHGLACSAIDAVRDLVHRSRSALAGSESCPNIDWDGGVPGATALAPPKHHLTVIGSKSMTA